MVKCPARSPVKGYKCNRSLLLCLRDGMHLGQRRFNKPSPRFDVESWHWDLATIVFSAPWQVKVRALLRSLDYECKYAAEDRNPHLYRKVREDRRFVAQFVVRERRNRFGVTVRRVSGSALPIGQKELDL